MIRLRKVSKRYRGAPGDERALRDVDLDIDAGAFVAIIGTSGSGKTTLLNLVGGLDRDYTGVVEVLGRDLSTLSDRALADFRNRSVGFVFQHFSLLDHLTAAENVALPHAFSRGADPSESPSVRALRALSQVGLEHKAGESPRNLSGGQKQRVAIARALFHEPRLLLCDEPTGSLDSVTGQQVIDTFAALNAQGYTVVIITHEVRVSSAARRVIRIEDGRITADDAGRAA
jgi:putative ABC transport system ATP-binding protein